MERGTKIIVGLILVIALFVVVACTDNPEPVEAKQNGSYSMNHIGAIEGIGQAQLWQDSNGCFWIRDDGGLKQIFKSSRNAYSDTQPYCE